MQIPTQVREELIRKLISGVEMGFSDRFLIAQMIEPNPKFEREREEPKVATPKFISQMKHKRRDWQDIMEKARSIISKRNRPIKMIRLAKLCGVKRSSGGFYSDFCAKIQSKYVVTHSKSRGSAYLVSEKSFEAAHEKPMLRKSQYNKYLSERIKYYIKNGLAYMDACHASIADYAKTHKGEVIAFVEFPLIKHIKVELLPILKDILKNMAMSGGKTGLKDLSYAIDISAKDYDEFVTDLLLKSGQVAKSLGINKSLAQSNGELYWK